MKRKAIYITRDDEKSKEMIKLIDNELLLLYEKEWTELGGTKIDDRIYELK